MSSAIEARLAPPGAGIPTIERLVGGMLLALRRWRRSREQLASEFATERNTITRLYEGVSPEVMRTRVLIPRLRGLEDSSRYWSVLMTLDHLRIVNDQIGRVIESLARETVPEGSASTAAVKPRPDAGPEACPSFEESCDRLSATVAACGALRTRARYAHPWFGPLDAAGWQAMAVVHLGIHRSQIVRILHVHAESPRETANKA